ncbi:MAG: HupE/UreJ family protein [Nevskia sp.]
MTTTRLDAETLRRRARALLALALLLPGVALAHTGAGGVDGFLSGFLHPLSGADHVVAMIAVGIWGAQLGLPAIWVLPVTFPMVMAFGGVLGVLGVPVPAVEYGIAFSGIVLGLMVAFAARVPLWFAGAIVGVFAIFHGHAHGAELPAAANPISYSAGFVLSTGLLHLCGVAIGLLERWRAGAIAMRACGAGIAAVGGYFLWVALAA